MCKQVFSTLLQHGVALVCVLAAVAAGPALGDTKVTMREGTEVTGDTGDMPEGMRQAFENQEATTAVYWFGEDRAARIGGTGSMISRLDRGESYIVNDHTKTYGVIKMDGQEGSISSTTSAELVKTGETRKIGSWDAEGYKMTVVLTGDEPSEIMLWVSDEVDVDLAPYRALVEASASQMGADWMRKYLEVDGFPVRQEFRMGPILSWQEVVAIDDASPPPGIYEPPAGYTRSD